MSIIRRLTKQLFGRNQVDGVYDVIIDGEIAPSNEEPGQAEIESSGHVSDFFKTKCHHRSKNQPKSSFTNQPERSKGAPMRLVLFNKTHKSLSSFQEKNLGSADHQIAKLIINPSNPILKTLFQGRRIIALSF